MRKTSWSSLQPNSSTNSCDLAAYGMAAARQRVASSQVLDTAQEVPTNLVDRYLWLGSHRVKGWLAPFSARFIAALARAQIRNGINSAVAEIGVHHGRLFILMHLTSRVGQKDIAIDIFEKQHLNRDHSGRGDLAQIPRATSSDGEGDLPM